MSGCVLVGARTRLAGEAVNLARTVPEKVCLEDGHETTSGLSGVCRGVAAGGGRNARARHPRASGNAAAMHVERAEFFFGNGIGGRSGVVPFAKFSRVWPDSVSARE